jgi:cytochrome c6
MRTMIVTAAVLLFATSIALAADGAAIYKSRCASCHGADGKADTKVAKAMKIPALAGDANVQKMATEEVVKRIKENKKHPSAVKSLSDTDVAAVAETVKKLAGAP